MVRGDKEDKYYAIIDYRIDDRIEQIKEGPVSNIDDCIEICDNIVLNLPDGAVLDSKPRCEIEK